MMKPAVIQNENDAKNVEINDRLGEKKTHTLNKNNQARQVTKYPYSSNV